MPLDLLTLPPDRNMATTSSQLSIRIADTIMAALGAGGVGSIVLGMNSLAHGNADAVTGLYSTAGLGAIFISSVYAMLRRGECRLFKSDTKS